MTDENRQLDPIEQALVEFRSAERAGVFRSTPLATGDLLERDGAPQPVSATRLAWRLLPVAAVLLIAVGVWSWMFVGQLNLIRGRAALVAENTAPSRSFADCLNGPIDTPLDPACLAHDLNHDGHVDLLDFGRLQLAFAAPQP